MLQLVFYRVLNNYALLLLIDNYDSFTHNLARYLVELGQTVEVIRNDEISVDDVADLSPDYLVLSPGPCTPDQAGISLDVVERFTAKIPILGVCLGHQTIAQAHGAKIVTANTIKHGMTSSVEHKYSQLFKQVPKTFSATRYHSLVVEPQSLSSEFLMTAWVDDFDPNQQAIKEIMAIEHRWLPLYGVQFHPESLMTEYGHRILENFLTHPNNAWIS